MSGARPLPLAQARGPSREQALAVGRGLHLARVARGIDPATVARDLLIPYRDLEALEGGDFGRVAGREGADIAARVSLSRPGAAEAPAEERRAGEVGGGPAPATPVPDGGPAPPERAGIVPAPAGMPGQAGFPPAPPDGRGGGPPEAGRADPASVPEPSPAPATSPTIATGEPVADGPPAGPVPAATVGPPLAAADDEEGPARVGDAAPAGVPPRVG